LTTQATSGDGLKTAADFFIVDNSDEHWKALEYVRQWCEISSAVDIATGHFEIGALLALDGQWQKVDKIRLLIGGETSRATVNAIRAAREDLETSLSSEREQDPFLSGIDAVIEAIRRKKIEIRVYRTKKFHAKAYITHGRLDVVGSAALVGSSNFTRPGLTKNVELNVRFTGVEVRELQSWFEEHWRNGEPVEEELLSVLEHQTREYTPFEIYARSLQLLTADLEPSAREWETSDSRIYPMLAPYQRQAYHGLKEMAKQWRGAFLTDGVGLGKTFVGLMLAEYYAVRERRNVLIMATKTGEEAVWRPEIARLLPDLTGDFTNLMVMAHTDLSRQNAAERVRQLAERADVVIVDEAHNFRNRGSRGDEEEGKNPSRWWRLYDICQGKLVFNLTATPINNRLFDFVRQLELFTGRVEQADSTFQSIGIGSLQAYVRGLEREILESATGAVDPADFESVVHDDTLFESVVIQNSRAYAVESARIAGNGAVFFSEQDLPRAVPYELTSGHKRLLDELDAAFEKDAPLFVLPMYYPLAYWRGEELDPEARRQENRQRQVVALIRSVFLKRFESSVAAFAGSCLDLTEKIRTWLYVNVQPFPEQAERLARWDKLYGGLLAHVREEFRPHDVTPDADAEDTSDVTAEEFHEMQEFLDPERFDLPAMVEAAFEDLVQMQRLLERVAELGVGGDGKYDRLLDLLHADRSNGQDEVFPPEFRTDKVIVFTEFADTARYIHDRLVADGVEHVDRLDGSRKADRLRMIQRFAPFYNRVEASERAKLAPLRVLVSTDVLSEGVNLQDGWLLVNYDLHWNPVRLMQRIGRVDRRLDAATEKQMEEETGRERGLVQVRNFLPPAELERLLRLYKRVSARAYLISKTLGIPGGKLFDEHDILDDVKVFQNLQKEYYGSITPIEELRLEYLKLVEAHPDLPVRLEAIPAGASTAKEGVQKGLFLCETRPIRVIDETPEGEERERWTLESGSTHWSFHRLEGDGLDEPGAIADVLRADEGTPRAAYSDRSELRARLAKIRASRNKAFVKSVSLPLDAPSPRLECWLEVR
jgi:superfamily II DNA or RNA helicase